MPKIGHNYSGKIIDAHLHLDDKGGKSAASAAADLAHNMAISGIGHAVALHLLWQPWSAEEFATAIAEHPSITGFINLVPRDASALADLSKARELGFEGLKLHPRMQRYFPDEKECVQLVKKAGELEMPVVIDCFPDGDWLLSGLRLQQYASLAQQAPKTRVVVAHAAGHHCLDLLMIAKRVPNLWIDISYSLLYYQSPVVDALFYMMKSLRYERVMFGSDFPDRPLAESTELALALLDKFGVTGEDRDRLLWRNAQQMLLNPSVLHQPIKLR